MTLFSQIIGTGPPLLILHGLFGMSDNWLTVGRQLASKGFNVHMVDLRNHGRSPHMDTHSFIDMCDDLLSYLEQENLESVGMIGHSMGGKAAMHMALRHPERLTDMVVVDIAPATYCCHEASLHAIILDTLMRIDPARYNSHGDIMAEIESGVNSRALTLFLGKNIRRSSDGKYDWKLNLPVLKAYLPVLYAGLEDLDALAPSTVKTLFIKGNNSDYIQSHHESNRVRYFPDSGVVGIDNAGHWVHAEQPERFVDVVTSFLLNNRAD